MFGITDKILSYVLGAGLLAALLFLGEQEIKLRHDISKLNASLNIEVQCRVGSTCAQRLYAEAAAGAALVKQAREDAAAENARQKAALDKQAMDAARQLQQSQQAAAQADSSWKQKYENALKTPDCAAWAKQVTSCAIR